MSTDEQQRQWENICLKFGELVKMVNCIFESSGNDEDIVSLRNFLSMVIAEKNIQFAKYVINIVEGQGIDIGDRTTYQGDEETKNNLRDLGRKFQEKNQKPHIVDTDIYIERPPVEDECYRAIVRPRALIRIRAPRRMGKTLLLQKILDYARRNNYKTVKVDFDLAGNDNLTDLKRCLCFLRKNVFRQLGLETINDDSYWQGDYGIYQYTNYIEDFVLSSIEKPIVLAFDKFELLFPHKMVFKEICSMLRAWYDKVTDGDRSSILWEKMRLVVVYSTESYPTLDINRSPFNVGKQISLLEFNQQQVETLFNSQKLEHFQKKGLDKLMDLIGGHPYLIQITLEQLRNQQYSLEKILNLSTTTQGIFGDHLRAELSNLEAHADLKSAYKQVILADKPVRLDTEIGHKLHSLGLVKFFENDLIPINKLYKIYFSANLR